MTIRALNRVCLFFLYIFYEDRPSIAAACRKDLLQRGYNAPLKNLCLLRVCLPVDDELVVFLGVGVGEVVDRPASEEAYFGK